MQEQLGPSPEELGPVLADNFQNKARSVEEGPKPNTREGEETTSDSTGVEPKQAKQNVEETKIQESDLEQIQSIREELGVSQESEKLSDVSKANIERIKTGFIQSTLDKEMFSSEAEAQNAITSEKEAIENNLSLTINLSAESVARFFAKGKQETLWSHLEEAGGLEKIKGAATSQGKDLHKRYIEYRETAESVLKQNVPEQLRDIKPAYAALAGGSSRDKSRGAAPEYGNFFFELDASELKNSALHYKDSFANITQQPDGSLDFDSKDILSVSDAVEAKAMVNLGQKYNAQFPTIGGVGGWTRERDRHKLVTVEGQASGYVEAAVFDEITPEKVKRVGIALRTEEDLKGTAELLERFPQYKDKMSFYINPEATGALSADWLEKNFPGKVESQTKAEGADQLWEELDLSADASLPEIRTALDRRANKLWRDIGIHLGEIQRSEPNPANIQSLEGNRWRLKGMPEITRKLNLYLEVEKGRRFFNSKLGTY